MKRFILLITILLSTTIATHAQAPTYKVYAIKFARSAMPFSVADWADDGPKTDSVKIDFMVWLIKGSDGKNILVDAGFLNDIDDAKEFKVADYVRPDSAVMNLGIKPGDITDIIFSHPHWDHIDGVTLFPNAHIWIQKDDYGFFVGDAWQKPGDNGYNKRDVLAMVIFNIAGKVTLVDGDDKEIIPGIKVFTGSRHTFNSQYVLVQTGGEKVILASDNIWIYYSLEHMVPASAGGTLDPAGYIKAMRRMKTMVSNPKYIIPGHDAQVFTRFQKVADGVVVIK